MTTTRQKSYKVLKGYSANIDYSNQLLFLYTAVIILSGTFLLWGVNTYMNVLNEKPICFHSKSL